MGMNGPESEHDKQKEAEAVGELYTIEDDHFPESLRKELANLYNAIKAKYDEFVSAGTNEKSGVPESQSAQELRAAFEKKYPHFEPNRKFSSTALSQDFNLYEQLLENEGKIQQLIQLNQRIKAIKKGETPNQERLEEINARKVALEAELNNFFKDFDDFRKASTQADFEKAGIVPSPQDGRFMSYLRHTPHSLFLRNKPAVVQTATRFPNPEQARVTANQRTVSKLRDILDEREKPRGDVEAEEMNIIKERFESLLRPALDEPKPLPLVASYRDVQATVNAKKAAQRYNMSSSAASEGDNRKKLKNK